MTETPWREPARSALLALALLALRVDAATAAQTTWADPAGSCNGESPCFTTLGAAVANAGPPPATVFAFPGTYAESVDLGAMGSALVGGSPGELSVVSVDASGQPAPGAVVDPGALGGPGTGSAVFANAFPAPVTLDGLAVRSPDVSGIDLHVATGAVRLARITADASPSGNGVAVLIDSGDVVIEDSSARLNGASGLVAGSAAGAVTVTDSFAERNSGAGGSFLGSRVEVTDSGAEGNDTNGLVIASDDATAARLGATGNGEIGVWVAPLTVAGGSAALAEIEASGNASGVVLGFHPAGFTFVDGEITGCTATANLDTGVTAEALSLRLDDVAATGNGGIGITAFAADAHLTACLAASNSAGVVASGGQVTLLGCSATDNGPFAGSLVEGNGFVLANVDRAEIADAHALDNDFGWLILDFDGAAAPMGMDPAAVRLELERLGGGRPRALAGKGGPAFQAISIVGSRTEGSAEASMRVGLRPGGTLAVHCSDFVANGPTGLALVTDNVVDARSNFWGDPSGPTHPGNPGGAGDVIQDLAVGFPGTVIYDPFLAAPAGAADCPLPAGLPEIPTLDPASLLTFGLALVLAAWGLLWRRP